MSSSAILLFLVALFLSASPACHGAAAGQQPGHNITDILLAANPNFADFSSALAGANLTAQIDGRRTVTVLAVDNAAVAQLKGRRLAPDSLAHVLSLHVLLDYYDDARLRQLNGSGTSNLVATLYQASGAAPGSAGLVNVSAAGGGRVSFLPSGAADPVFYQKSIKESGYDISVLQVSGVFSSPAAEGKAAPATPPPSQTPAPSPAPVAPSPAPVAAAPAPVAKPAPAPAQAPAPAREAPAPSPKGNPSPPPKQAPDAPAPADAPEPPADEPPADQQKNAASGTEEWSLGAPVAAVVLAVVFLMW